MMSATSAFVGRADRSSTKGGSPCMPWLVVCTTRVAPSRAASLSVQSSTWIVIPNSCAKASALSRVRLSNLISVAPASIRLTKTAREAPPAPKTTQGPAFACQAGWTTHHHPVCPKAAYLLSLTLSSLIPSDPFCPKLGLDLDFGGPRN